MSQRSEQNEDVSIQLSRPEALVLFEFLSRFNETDRLVVEDQAESRVLWNLLALLERELTEPFYGNYAELLAAARVKLHNTSS